MQSRPVIIMKVDKIENVDIHFLPCTITQSGMAPVDQFFIPNNNEVSFHGRRLVGEKLDQKLLVFTKEDGQLKLQSTSKDVYYWKYDEQVEDDDRIKQMFMFPQVLDVLHQTIELE